MTADERLIARYADGECTQQDARRARMLIEERTDLAEYYRFINGLSAPVPVYDHDAVRSRILSSIDSIEEQHRLHRYRMMLSPVFSLASACALFLAALHYLSRAIDGYVQLAAFMF